MYFSVSYVLLFLLDPRLEIPFLVSGAGHFSMNISWPPLILTLNVRQPLAAYESKLFALTHPCLNVSKVAYPLSIRSMWVLNNAFTKGS